MMETQSMQDDGGRDASVQLASDIAALREQLASLPRDSPTDVGGGGSGGGNADGRILGSDSGRDASLTSSGRIASIDNDRMTKRRRRVEVMCRLGSALSEYAVCIARAERRRIKGAAAAAAAASSAAAAADSTASGVRATFEHADTTASSGGPVEAASGADESGLTRAQQCQMESAELFNRAMLIDGDYFGALMREMAARAADDVGKGSRRNGGGGRSAALCVLSGEVAPADGLGFRIVGADCADADHDGLASAHAGSAAAATTTAQSGGAVTTAAVVSGSSGGDAMAIDTGESSGGGSSSSEEEEFDERRHALHMANLGVEQYRRRLEHHPDDSNARQRFNEILQERARLLHANDKPQPEPAGGGKRRRM